MQLLDHGWRRKALAGDLGGDLRRPDATIGSWLALPSVVVSILIRPEGRMQQVRVGVVGVDAVNVSILIRPEGRMQPLAGICASVDTYRFQSSSGQKAGCNTLAVWRIVTSIVFQSSSGQKAGCNPAGLTIASRAYVFQSSSGQKAGCNPSTSGNVLEIPGFNPHPARRPDATGVPGMAETLRNTFQSSSGQKAGCNHLQIVVNEVAHPVSILIRPEGRMQLA